MKFLVINYVSQFVKWSGMLFRVTVLIDLVFILLVRWNVNRCIFFLLSVLYFMGMNDLQDSRWRRGTIFIFLHDFQLIRNMDLFLCNYTSEITTSKFLITEHVLIALFQMPANAWYIWWIFRRSFFHYLFDFCYFRYCFV